MKLWFLSALFLLALGACGRRVLPPDDNRPSPAAPATERAQESPELTLTGFDRSQPCKLFVHREWFENNEKSKANYRVKVSTSYSHEGSGIGEPVLAFSPTEENILQWENKKTGEYLKLTVFNTDSPLSDPDSFTLRWRHDKHHHKNTCKDLRAR